jgi:hypothetical protein
MAHRNLFGDEINFPPYKVHVAVADTVSEKEFRSCSIAAKCSS